MQYNNNISQRILGDTYGINNLNMIKEHISKLISNFDLPSNYRGQYLHILTRHHIRHCRGQYTTLMCGTTTSSQTEVAITTK